MHSVSTFHSNPFFSTAALLYAYRNYLDISSFGLEVVATGAWFARGGENAVRGLLATSILLLFMKTMYFARGFPLWGPLVRMLVNIVDDMRPFVLSKLLFKLFLTSYTNMHAFRGSTF